MQWKSLDIEIFSILSFTRRPIRRGLKNSGDNLLEYMTEKRKPTYDLDAFKAAFNSMEKLAVMGTALRSAAALGFGRAEIVMTLQTMRREHF